MSNVSKIIHKSSGKEMACEVVLFGLGSRIFLDSEGYLCYISYLRDCILDTYNAYIIWNNI